MSDAMLACITALQYGVFTTRHALDSGLSAAQIKRRQAAGLWVPVHLNAYRLAGAPPTWKGNLLAAC